MSTAKSVLGIPLLALSVLLVVMVVGFVVPVDAQSRSLYGITPTVAAPTDTPEPTDTPIPTDTPVPTNTPRPSEPKPQPSVPTETPVPILPLSGAERPAGLLLPAILVLAAVLSCTYVAATRNIRH